MTMETTIENGMIKCSKHGSLTAIDCDSLQGNSCSGCFIYAALKNMSTDLEEFTLDEVKDSSEKEMTVN